MNIQIIKGRLTADPELSQTPSNVAVCKFSVAVDRGYTPKGEEKKADFFNVVAWRNTAEFVSKYFVKGQQILITGEMQCRNFTDKENIKRYIWELIADKVVFCGDKQQSRGGTVTPKNYGSTATPENDVYVDISDDDIPF